MEKSIGECQNIEQKIKPFKFLLCPQGTQTTANFVHWRVINVSINKSSSSFGIVNISIWVLHGTRNCNYESYSTNAS